MDADDNWLWKNICSLMRAENPSLDAVQKRTKVGRGTIQRIKAGDAATRRDSLETIAKSFGIQPWQLMFPGLNPDALPVVHLAQPQAAPDMSALERRIAALEEAAAQPDAKPRKQNGTHG